MQPVSETGGETLRARTFADFCCGIGGFHAALAGRLGMTCVFASDIDADCREVYKTNYGIEPHGDLTKIDAKDVPPFDVLCAGFPCQPFSKAGDQAGFGDQRGNIFFELCRFVEAVQPSYLMLENVRNLASHDNGNTWAVIRARIREMGYATYDKPLILNALNYDVPQYRERVFLLCTRQPQSPTPHPMPKPRACLAPGAPTLHDLVDPSATRPLYPKHVVAGEVWDDFLSVLAKHSIPVPRFPLLTDTWDSDAKGAAFYAKYKACIDKNRAFYHAHHAVLQPWIERSRAKPLWVGALRKLEWQVQEKRVQAKHAEGHGATHTSMRDVLWSPRGSGIRVKAADYSPTLVAMASMVPIYGPLWRELTPRECARLQCFPETFILHKKDKVAYKQFGNAVNVAVVERCARHLFRGEPLYPPTTSSDGQQLTHHEGDEGGDDDDDDDM